MSDKLIDGVQSNQLEPAPATVIHKPYRWTFGAFCVQVLLLSAVAAGAFGGGYLFRDSQGLSSDVDVMQERLSSLEQVATLEQTILELKLANAEREARRSTVIELDLEAIMTPLRQSVLEAADALATQLGDDVIRQSSEVTKTSGVFGPALSAADEQLEETVEVDQSQF